MAAANVALQFVGCNDDQGAKPVDAGNAPPTPDAGLPACAGEMPVAKIALKDGTLADPDWSCYDPNFEAGTMFPMGLDAGDADPDALLSDAEADAPTDAADGGIDATTDAGPDADTRCRMRLTDFVALTPVPSADIELFFNNDISGAASFSATTADPSAGAPAPGHAGTGEFFFPPPGSDVMAYRVKARPSGPGLPELLPLYQLDTLAPKPGAQYEQQSITAGSRDLLAAGLLGSVRVDPARMIIVIGVRDCQYREVLGGTVDLIDDATGKSIIGTPGTETMRTSYFGSGGFPDSQCTHTVANQALFAALNVPTDRSITARAHARTGVLDPAPGRTLGEKKIPIIPGNIVIRRPYRVLKSL